LLHFNKVLELDQEKLRTNKKISESRGANKYVFHELKKLMVKYTKNKYDAHTLMERIPDAIANEKSFSESVQELENKLGSTVGLLLAEIMGS